MRETAATFQQLSFTGSMGANLVGVACDLEDCAKDEANILMSASKQT